MPIDSGSRWKLLRTISFAARQETRRQQAAVNKIRLLARRRSRRRCDSLSMISETGESLVTDVGDVASLVSLESVTEAPEVPSPASLPAASPSSCPSASPSREGSVEATGSGGAGEASARPSVSTARLMAAISGATTSMLIISTLVALLLGCSSLYFVPIADVLMPLCEAPEPEAPRTWLHLLRLTTPPAAPPSTFSGVMLASLASRLCA